MGFGQFGCVCSPCLCGESPFPDFLFATHLDNEELDERFGDGATALWRHPTGWNAPPGGGVIEEFGPDSVTLEALRRLPYGFGWGIGGESFFWPNETQQKHFFTEVTIGQLAPTSGPGNFGKTRMFIRTYKNGFPPTVGWAVSFDGSIKISTGGPFPFESTYDLNIVQGDVIRTEISEGFPAIRCLKNGIEFHSWNLLPNYWTIGCQLLNTVFQIALPGHVGWKMGIGRIRAGWFDGTDRALSYPVSYTNSGDGPTAGKNWRLDTSLRGFVPANFNGAVGSTTYALHEGTLPAGYGIDTDDGFISGLSPFFPGPTAGAAKMSVTDEVGTVLSDSFDWEADLFF